MHTLKIHYRPDNYPDWVEWREFSEIMSVIGEPSKIGIGGLPSARAGFLPRLSFGKPQDGGDGKETGRKLRRCYNVQVRFRGTGSAVLDRQAAWQETYRTKHGAKQTINHG
jgi:hypothetical protein